MNRIILKGNLVDDPETTQVGAQNVDKCKFRVASNNVHGNTVFVDIESWRKTAVNCGKYLSKGSAVLVDGRLDQSDWENNEGQKRSRLFVVADTVEFLNKQVAKEEEEDDVPF